MEPYVKILPTTLQAILLHFAVDVTREMRGILVGSDFSWIIGTQLGVVGWYHSHSELDATLTKQDIDFHLKFTAKFPNSVALVGTFGRRSDDQMYYTVACLALENVLKIAEECVFSQQKGEKRNGGSGDYLGTELSGFFNAQTDSNDFEVYDCIAERLIVKILVGKTEI
ncbi:hypothetical protein TSMEX_010369 [Taenia solium]|eukprot:TsM_000670700 transcript=TsM_000670700 gene=TsM_000670700